LIYFGSHVFLLSDSLQFRAFSPWFLLNIFSAGWHSIAYRHRLSALQHFLESERILDGIAGLVVVEVAENLSSLFQPG
jgi:hypothetical protein